ncbi:methionyl-tRNA formyltransferase [Candidatus Koribacter versatilis Ellin345]|uniref:Methionyl-tRNA formyltransferase n=1 Tax=Koribacter versatilis (strain Ellin345) TaxID=204669 RepID=FMT_KORVE|nr:methionyl-tRNA formyltransferase [Candidatus Koribacter versatilis]Q1IIS2.1 RecName: Full=Methionyl-tRNA formyltransferase [Candidatus Koribacter versatilis Ellin345]ABF43228.1 methionyl-tRNA formyltransferase [Candidatus Koribacter versatilis Ellin345]
MILVFCGTPRFAVPSLEHIVRAGHDVRLVVTQPDRPKGRGMGLAFSPVKDAALALNLPVTQPEKIKNNEEFRAQLSAIAPDAIIVVGYGRIIPQWMIDLPPLGNINVHASLLPKYRGAAPIQWAIAMGEAVTGVTTMKIDAGLDTGDMLLQAEMPIAPEDTSESLAPRLAELGAELLVETLARLEGGVIAAVPQNHAEHTLAPILKKEDGQIDFHRSAQEILNRLRGFTPWPGAFTQFRGKGFFIHQARAVAATLEPGELRIEGENLLVGAGHNTALELLEIQLEGKKRMPARDFINGYRPNSADKLGRLSS